MKLRLVVASGVHEGKPIPITTPQFVIGRDPQCQLRPASTAISKRHCAILVRGGKVFVRDFGSTNGTFVNDQLVQGEVEIHNGDRLKVGPLDFTLQVERTKAATPPAAKPPAAEDDVVDVGARAEPTGGPASDELADLLLGDDSDSSTSAATPTLDSAAVPDGSTVVELPAVPKPGEPAEPPKPKSTVGSGNTSQAAADILSKYYRRPRS